MNVNLDRRITIDRLVPAQDGTFGASTPTWAPHVSVYAERQDTPPSRDESVRQGLAQARNQVRWRIRWRDDLDSTMRIRETGRVYQIIGGPSEIGPRRTYLEIMTEEYSTTGGAA